MRVILASLWHIAKGISIVHGISIAIAISIRIMAFKPVPVFWHRKSA